MNETFCVPGLGSTVRTSGREKRWIVKAPVNGGQRRRRFPRRRRWRWGWSRRGEVVMMECLLEQTSGRDRKDLFSFSSSYSDRCSFTKGIIYRHIIYRKASTGLSFRSSIHELLYTPGLSYKPEWINLSLPPVGFFIMSADIGTFCWNDACKKYIICTRCSFRSTWFRSSVFPRVLLYWPELWLCLSVCTFYHGCCSMFASTYD